MGIFHFELYRYTAAGYVHRLVFYGHILMNGLFAPVESMPKWAQILTKFNPVKYFVQVMRMVMLKGAGLSDIYPQIVKTAVYALVMTGLTIVSYKKVN